MTRAEQIIEAIFNHVERSEVDTDTQKQAIIITSFKAVFERLDELEAKIDELKEKNK